MQGGLVICLDSGILLWQRSVVRNFGMKLISGKSRDAVNLGAFFYALYRNSSLIRQPRPSNQPSDSPEPDCQSDTLTFNMGRTTLYLRPNHTKRTLCALFVHVQVSRASADALSDWICSHFTKETDMPRFWRSVHAHLSYMLDFMAYPLVCAALGVRLGCIGCKQAWLMVVRGEDLKRAGERLHPKRDGRRQSHISPLADIRFRLFGLDGVDGTSKDPSRRQAGSAPGVNVMLLLQTISKAQDVMWALSGEVEDVQSMAVHVGQWADTHSYVNDGSTDDIQQPASGVIHGQRDLEQHVQLCVLQLEEFMFTFAVPDGEVFRSERVVARLWREDRSLVQDFLAFSRSVI